MTNEEVEKIISRLPSVSIAETTNHRHDTTYWASQLYNLLIKKRRDALCPGCDEDSEGNFTSTPKCLKICQEKNDLPIGDSPASQDSSAFNPPSPAPSLQDSIKKNDAEAKMYDIQWSAWEHSRRRNLEQLAYNMMESLDDRKKMAVHVSVKYDFANATPVTVESAKLIEMKTIRKEHREIYARFMFALNTTEEHDNELTCCLFVFQVEGAPDGINDFLAIDASVHLNLWDINKPRKSLQSALKEMNAAN